MSLFKIDNRLRYHRWQCDIIVISYPIAIGWHERFRFVLVHLLTDLSWSLRLWGHRDSFFLWYFCFNSCLFVFFFYRRFFVSSSNGFEYKATATSIHRDGWSFDSFFLLCHSRNRCGWKRHADEASDRNGESINGICTHAWCYTGVYLIRYDYIALTRFGFC